MANRHLSRSIVLQSLFERDFRSAPDNTIEEILHRHVDEFAPGMGDFSFVKNLADGVLKKRKDIDTIIEKAAPEWPIDKIAMVDRNVLRIGLFELIFGDRKEVPAKVAINEAIELAKSFGGETSGKFVNGVLGAVYKEMGEPGKEEVSTRKEKEKKKEVPYEEMPIKVLGGSVVYAMHEGEMYLAMVHDVFGHWTLSKGKLEAGESVQEGVIREIKEEMGIDIVIESTGRFTTPEDLKLHITAGAKKVVLSAPEKTEHSHDTFVFGANEDKLEADHTIISNASCTTNSIAPVMAVLTEKLGIEKSMLTTVHSYTASQSLQDGPSKDLREGRNAAENIVPTSTGAAKATALTVPDLADMFDGISIRVPTPVVSLSDMTLLAKRDTTVEEINDILTKASKEERYKGILAVTNEPLVSSDLIGDSHSSIVDLGLTRVVAGNLVKVVAWYDNEWGYSNRLVEMVALAGHSLKQ